MKNDLKKSKNNQVEPAVAILDSVSPKFGTTLVAYHETGDLFADTCAKLWKVPRVLLMKLSIQFWYSKIGFLVRELLLIV